MQEFFKTIGEHNTEMVLGFLIIAATVITVVALIQWRKVRLAEQETLRKQEMLQRDMSADEIVQVLTTSRGGAAGGQRPAPDSARKTADYNSR